MKKYRVAIIGSGPAGYAAATYTSRAELSTVIVAGPEPGGQLMKTTEVENYPGFEKGIVGPQLMDEMRKQAVRFGTELVWETVVKVRKLKSENLDRFEIETETGSKTIIEAVILAMGARSKMLGIGEEKYYGKGFSTCAVCDAAFYKGKKVFVVGGGDAAVEDAWALTKFASSVTMLVRGTSLRASKYMQRKILSNPDKVEVKWETTLKEIRGERVEELTLSEKGKEVKVKAEGLFFAIGHEPATGFLKESGVLLDEKGYVKTGITYPSMLKLSMTNDEGDGGASPWLEKYPTMTSVEGIFAAGDCVDFRYRQAATASGMGVMAALDAEKWLERE